MKEYIVQCNDEYTEEKLEGCQQIVRCKDCINRASNPFCAHKCHVSPGWFCADGKRSSVTESANTEKIVTFKDGSIGRITRLD